MRYGHRIDAMKADSLDQKLQIILKSDEYPDPAIGKYFRLTKERREIIYQARNRKICYSKIIRDGNKEEKKIMVFHEKISQLEEVISPKDYRKEMRKNKDDREQAVDDELQKMLETKRYKPVMYHSKQNPRWNRWGMEWFRQGVANTMFSVKALIEGVDVPSADLGIIRVSSSSVRQRIQTVGRILRKGRDKTAEIYVLFALDTVDENIFRAFDWNEELGVSSVNYFIGDVYGARGIGEGKNINLAQKVWNELGKDSRFELVSIIDDKYREDNKVSRIWGKRKGIATKLDRLLVICKDKKKISPVKYESQIDWKCRYPDRFSQATITTKA